MSKSCYTNKEARKISQADLQNHLYGYYGSSDRKRRIELANTATLIKAGEVRYTDVEIAIDDGWNPADMDIYEWFGEEVR